MELLKFGVNAYVHEELLAVHGEAVMSTFSHSVYETKEGLRNIMEMIRCTAQQQQQQQQLSKNFPRY